MWETLQRKQDIIDTIMGQKHINEEEIIEIMIEEIIDEYE